MEELQIKKAEVAWITNVEGWVGHHLFTIFTNNKLLKYT
jgi:hypothetical protein